MNVTHLIIITNALLFLAILSNKINANSLIYDNLAIKNNKEWYRMLISGFTHTSIMHIAFNMLALLSFGMYIEAVVNEEFMAIWPTKLGYFMGRVAYFLLYLLSILGGSMYIYFTKKGEYYALGASGGVFGIVYACILLTPNIGISLFFIPVAIPGWILGIIISIGSIVLSLMPRNYISHEGHLGGGLIGGLCMFVFMVLNQVALQTKSVYFLLFGILTAGIFLVCCIVFPKHIEKLRLFLFRKLEKD